MSEHVHSPADARTDAAFDQASARETTAPRMATPAADDIDMLEIVRLLYRRRWSMITIFAIVVAAVVAQTFTATPVFEARARLLIESDDPNVVSFKAVVDEGQANADYYQTQYGILQSRELARRTIASLNLAHAPAFGANQRSGIREKLWSSSERAAAAANESPNESALIDTFLKNLSVEPLRNSRLVDVKFRSTDPDLAARVVNQLAQHYIEHTLEYKFTASKDASTFLATQLTQQRKAVENAESALQRYREQTDAVALDSGNIVTQKLEELNTAVTHAKTERLQKEAVERQLEAVEQDPAALGAFPAVLGNPFIQAQKAALADLQRQQAQMSEKLGALHPEMLKLQSAIQNAQAKIKAETANVVRSVHTDYEAALAQERSLTTALNQQKQESLTMNRKAIEYSVLAREVESSRGLYDSLLQRAKETGVSGELRSSNIRVIDRAERPRSAVSPRPLMNLLLAVFGGLALAVAFAFFYEYVDSRLRDPDEVRACLGLVSLGMLPALGKRWNTERPLINKGVPPNFSEMFRTIRTNILFSSPAGSPRTLAITSSGPGEGKTLVSSNLAIAFAQAGQRVLLIDADMRRSQAHHIFDIEVSPGLSNVIVGDASAADAVQQTAVPGLWVMPGGHVPPNPVELLASQRFRDVLASASEQFDTVIIDTPPAMLVADPVLIANAASYVLFVVGAEMTSRHTARHAIEQLSRGNAKVLGAILNRVQVERNRYYYSRYYGGADSAYYGEVRA